MPTRICTIKYTGDSLIFKISKVRSILRPEDNIQEGKPWTDPRADLYLKRFWSIGNQKMLLENKVDR